MKQAIVIGAGIGGIAVALRLKSLGYKVSVIEKNTRPGGKLDQFTWEGFRWDMGPSLFTLPQLVDELFDLFPESKESRLQYDKLKVVCRYFFPDQMVIDAFNSPEEFSEEVENKVGVSRKTILNYLRKSEQIYKYTGPVFIFSTFHKFNWKRIKNGLRALFNFYKLQAFKTMHNSNQRFLKEPHLVQIFDRFATYNGSNPYKAPATLNVIPFLEHCLGAYFPHSGMYSIIDTMVKLAEEQGIKFLLGEKAQQINHDKKRVYAVETNKGKYECDLVVSDSDIVPLYKLFNPKIEIKQRFKLHERSSSALIFYWAIDKTFPQVDLHNIFFSKDYKKEFECLFDKKTVCDDPTVYAFISSKHVQTDAPKGKENWFVMINAPTNIGQDWDSLVEKARKAIVRKLNRYLNDSIEDYILNEVTLDPGTIELKTSSFQGSLYGASSNSKWSAFQRHANFSGKLEGMYFVGGSVHPGGGIPLCLSSAKIVGELIQEQNS